LDQSLNVYAILREVAQSGVDYPGQIISILGWNDVDMSEFERELGLRDWVLRALFFTEAKDIQKGVTLKKIASLIQVKHPKHYHPTENQVERVIRAVQSSQLAKGQALFDYDRQAKLVRCVDKGYVLWRQKNQKASIEQLIFEGSASR